MARRYTLLGFVQGGKAHRRYMAAIKMMCLRFSGILDRHATVRRCSDYAIAERC